MFDTVDPELIEARITGFLESHLGRVDEALFYRPGVGVVAGVRLSTGREVVVKIHRWNVTLDRLAAVQLAQTQLADKGLPAPRPLVAPEPLGAAIGTVEELLAGGSARGHDPVIREACVATDWPGHFPNGPTVVGRLIRAGADVNASSQFDSHTETALHWAASSDEVDVLDALLDAGAHIDARGAVLGGGTALADACGFGNWAAAGASSSEAPPYD